MTDERTRFEAEEIRAMVAQHGATRGYTKDGVGYWQFPAWICPHCSAIAGPDAEVQPGCPQPLARHGRLGTSWRASEMTESDYAFSLKDGSHGYAYVSLGTWKVYAWGVCQVETTDLVEVAKVLNRLEALWEKV